MSLIFVLYRAVMLLLGVSAERFDHEWARIEAMSDDEIRDELGDS